LKPACLTELNVCLRERGLLYTPGRS